MGAFEKNLIIVEDNLEDGEVIQTVITATVRDESQRANVGATGALAITDRRVVFRGGGGFVPKTSRDTRLTSINSFETTEAPKYSLLQSVTFKINFSGGNDEFFIRPDEADEFLSMARKSLSTVQQTPKNSTDMSSELEKLSALHDSGIIDAAEFKAAKAKLLGL